MWVTICKHLLYIPQSGGCEGWGGEGGSPGIAPTTMTTADGGDRYEVWGPGEDSTPCLKPQPQGVAGHIVTVKSYFPEIITNLLKLKI